MKADHNRSHSLRYLRTGAERDKPDFYYIRLMIRFTAIILLKE